MYYFIFQNQKKIEQDIVMHLSYEETVPFKLLCLKGNVEAVDASPHSYNIALDINRNIIKGETY